MTKKNQQRRDQPPALTIERLNGLVRNGLGLRTSRKQRPVMVVKESCKAIVCVFTQKGEVKKHPDLKPREECLLAKGDIIMLKSRKGDGYLVQVESFEQRENTFEKATLNCVATFDGQWQPKPQSIMPNLKEEI